MLNAATGAMRSLHDSVLSLEKRRLSENDVAYPVFVAKVPEGKGFVDGDIGGTIVLRFDDIFAMFNLHPLHYTFVRLFSLSMEMRIIRDKTPDIVIVDPFYMRAKILGRGVRSSCGLMTSLLCLTFIRCTTPSFGCFR